MLSWRGGRVVECGSLENYFRVKLNGGSNPPLSVQYLDYSLVGKFKRDGIPSGNAKTKCFSQEADGLIEGFITNEDLLFVYFLVCFCPGSNRKLFAQKTLMLLY